MGSPYVVDWVARNVARCLGLGNVCGCCFLFIEQGINVLLVGGNDVVVRRHVGADGVFVRGVVQGKQRGGKGLGAIVGEFTHKGLVDEGVADVLEVVHAAPEGDGNAGMQGFERVVTAARDEAAADVGQVADAVVVFEFAEGVKEVDVVAVAWRFASAAQAGGVASIADVLDDGVPALGVAWGDDEAGVRQVLL